MFRGFSEFELDVMMAAEWQTVAQQATKIFSNRLGEAVIGELDTSVISDKSEVCTY